MEYYQSIQGRTAETVAVVNQHLPGLTIGGVTSAGLLADSQGLGGLAQTRDDALAAYDAANNAENQGFLTIQGLALSLPQADTADLDDEIPAESALIDLFSPVFAIKPRTTALAVERGKKLVSALTKTNAHLTGLTPPRAPITSSGKGLANLTTALDAQPALGQTEEDRAADASSTRTDLRVAATAVDRLNKRFYSRLLSESRENAALAAALSQITTEKANQPGTLGIRTILQGGADDLHLLISYDNGSYNSTATNTVEWMVVGTDADFSHSTPADPSGNSLGPFAVGSIVKLRTRVSNPNGTTTGSVRTLVIAAM
ncbi:MAG: hypothetical protein ABIT37_20480 [Luteolibacter sp.]